MLGRVRLTMTMTNVLVVAIVVVALLITAFFVARTVINRNADSELLAIASSVQQTPGRSGIGAFTVGRSPFGRPNFSPDDGTRIGLREFGRRDPPLEFAVYSSEGEMVLAFLNISTDQSLANDVQSAFAGNQEISTVDIDGAPFRVVTRPITDSNGDIVSVVQVAESRQTQEQIVNTLRNVLLTVGGAGLVFAAGAGYVLTGRSMRPVDEAFERQRAFVSDAAHELRTPLAIIAANAEALEIVSPNLESADQELLAGIRTESSYLAALVSKLLEMARLDFDEEHLADEVDLAQATLEACEAVAVLAEAQGVTLLSPAQEYPVAIHGDRVLVRLIILSLLDNAIKHSGKGSSVTVDVEAVGATASVSIKDTGPGISEEHIERVFDRFYRVDRARSRKTGGAGLGLAIAHRAAEVIDGRLRLSSEVGTGTTATVEFRLLSSV